MRMEEESWLSCNPRNQSSGFRVDTCRLWCTHSHTPFHLKTCGWRRGQSCFTAGRHGMQLPHFNRLGHADGFKGLHNSGASVNFFQELEIPQHWCSTCQRPRSSGVFGGETIGTRQPLCFCGSSISAFLDCVKQSVQKRSSRWFGRIALIFRLIVSCRGFF